MRLTATEVTLLQRFASGNQAGCETFMFHWSDRMKKILIVAAAAGLASLAACNSTPTNTTAENVAESHEANATAYDAMADNSTNATAEAVLENAADVEENKADAAEANAM